MLGRVLPGRYGDAVEEVRSGVLPWLMEQQQQQQQQQQLRSLRDFLLVYNRMTELCFQRCVPSLHHRALDAEEEACLHSCAGKLIHSNHRLMAAYVQLMPALVQRRIADYEAVATGPGAAEQPGNSPPGS